MFRKTTRARLVNKTSVREISKHRTNDLSTQHTRAKDIKTESNKELIPPPIETDDGHGNESACGLTETTSMSASVSVNIMFDPSDDHHDVPTAKSINAHTMSNCNLTLSKFLQHAGNANAWKSVIEHFKLSPVAIVIYGPHGCGKTRGVYDLFQSAKIEVSEINASHTQGVATFRRECASTRNSKSLSGNRVLLIDDIESFDSSYIKAVVEMVKARALRGAILTCANIYDAKVRSIRMCNIPLVRMYAPRANQMLAAIETINTSRPPKYVVSEMAKTCNGNLHQLTMRIRHRVLSNPDSTVDVFHTTRKLLNSTTDVDTWCRAGDDELLKSLLFASAPLNVDIERYADFVEVGSATSACAHSTYALGYAARVLLYKENAVLKMQGKHRMTKTFHLDSIPISA